MASSSAVWVRCQYMNIPLFDYLIKATVCKTEEVHVMKKVCENHVIVIHSQGQGCYAGIIREFVCIQQMLTQKGQT